MALSALLVLGAFLALSYMPASDARTHLIDARQALERGQDHLIAGDAAEARSSFDDALNHFTEARGSMQNPLLRTLSWLPLVGRTPDTVTGIAEAGQEAARAGVVIADALDELPGGLAALTPTGGVFPTEYYPSLAAGAEEAASLMETALRTLQATPASLLLEPVQVARTEAIAQITSLHDSLSTAAAILDGLPGFLGRSADRRYFFGAQNPAELRGTGGLVGAFSILELHDGRFHFSDFRSITVMPTFSPRRVGAPSPDYARNYDRYGGAGFWSNINMTPDFPSAAEAIELAYAEATGLQLDGVMLADPLALQAMLEVTGPVEVPELEVRLDAENVVPYTTNLAYALFRNSAKRKALLGEAAGAVLERFLSSTVSPFESARVLAETASAGHLLIYSNDPAMEEALSTTGAGGALAPPGGDFLSVVVNNAGANKIDFYADRSVEYAVRLAADGTADVAARVTLVNHAPLDGLPRYVLGHNPGGSERGENVSLVNLYCPLSSGFVGKSAIGQDQDLGYGTERGLRFTQDYVHIPSGGSATLGYSLTALEAWSGGDSGGTYRLTFLNQRTIRPTELRVEVRVPEGMDVTSTSVPMAVQGDTAVWEGEPGRMLEIEVSFQPPLPSRVWGSIWRFLNTPIVRF